MKAYKGFNRNDDGKLSCRGFIYEPGKTHKHEGKIRLCKSGFHACHELWQTWPYYPNNGVNEFWEVECGGKIIDSYNGDGKFVCSEITLLKKIDIDGVARFDNLFVFYEGLARVHVDGKWNFIDTEGKLLSERWFDDAWDFSGGFSVVALNGKWNHIDTEGNLLSEQWFCDACSFHEGFARVEIDGKWNFINTEGKLLSEQWYDGACDFFEGFARVKLEGKWMLINAKGEFV